MTRQKSVFLLLFLIISSLAYSQRRAQYTATGSMQNVGRGENSYVKLIDNVRFDLKDDETIIYGDSAVYYKNKGIMIVYGRVKVLQGDSVTITSRLLNFYQMENKAEFRQNVEYDDGQMKLNTNYLDYFTKSKDVRYYNKGTIVDDGIVLTSNEGRLSNIDNKFTFTGTVELVTPDYTLESEKLIYDRTNKEAVTPGKTKTTLKDGEVIWAEEGGTYNTDGDQVQYKSGKIETPDYEIFGDELFFDDIRQMSTAKGNVIVFSKEDDLVIFGDEAISSKEVGYTKIWGNTMLMKPFDKDTLFMKADTLISLDSDVDSLKRIIAYNKVKFHKPDIQGIADSLVYYNTDSVLAFYHDPVIWSEKQQMSADTIKAILANGNIDQIMLRQSSFVMAEDTVGNYNQIKGRNMTAFFAENEIQQLTVEGNAESIYFMLDEDDNFYLIGMNRLICSDMRVIFVNGEIDNYSAYVKPDARFIPQHELNEPERRLPGFSWRAKDRPKLLDILPKDQELQLKRDDKINEINKKLNKSLEEDIQERKQL